jgi:hypothetical protein
LTEPDNARTCCPNGYPTDVEPPPEPERAGCGIDLHFAVVYERTARVEILDAMRSLSRRHGRRDFSPAEIIGEARLMGSEHPDSTLRTHVVSAMCINAPPNHAVRYDDLERIAPGRYALVR